MTSSHNNPLQKNQLIPLEITSIAHDGNGVGHWDGIAVFVPTTAPGDRIQARIVKVQSRLAYGIVERMEFASSNRADPGCPVFHQCGGCSLRHISYSEEVRIKHSWVEENIRRIGGIPLVLEPPLPSPSPLRYRNKAQYPVGLVNGRIAAGFYAKRSHRIIPIADCPLQPTIFGELAGVICAFLEEHHIPPYDEEDHKGLVRHIYLRRGEATGQVMACLVLNGNGLPHWEALLEQLKAACPGLATLVLNHNTNKTNVILGPRNTVLWGSGYIDDILCGVAVRLSPHSFYQVNHAAAEVLYRQALEYAAPRPEDLLLDLYCGAGTIGLSMAQAVKEVVGIEIVEQAVGDARENAARNCISNSRFLCADAAQGVRRLLEEGLAPDIVLVDPPRKGLSASTIDSIMKMSPGKVVYISCNSATLARDLTLFAKGGYHTAKGRAVDLFPRTAHVESLVLLQRGELP